MTDIAVLRMAVQSLTAAQMSMQAFLVTSEAAITALQHAITTLQPPAPSSDAGCPHPKGQLIDARSMGHPNRWHCTQCEQEVDLA